MPRPLGVGSLDVADLGPDRVESGRVDVEAVYLTSAFVDDLPEFVESGFLGAEEEYLLSALTESGFLDGEGEYLAFVADLEPVGGGYLTFAFAKCDFGEGNAWMDADDVTDALFLRDRGVGEPNARDNESEEKTRSRDFPLVGSLVRLVDFGVLGLVFALASLSDDDEAEFTRPPDAGFSGLVRTGVFSLLLLAGVCGFVVVSDFLAATSFVFITLGCLWGLSFSGSPTWSAFLRVEGAVVVEGVVVVVVEGVGVGVVEERRILVAGSLKCVSRWTSKPSFVEKKLFLQVAHLQGWKDGVRGVREPDIAG